MASLLLSLLTLPAFGWAVVSGSSSDYSPETLQRSSHALWTVGAAHACTVGPTQNWCKSTVCSGAPPQVLLFWCFQLSALTGFLHFWRFSGPRNDVQARVLLCPLAGSSLSARESERGAPRQWAPGLSHAPVHGSLAGASWRAAELCRAL